MLDSLSAPDVYDKRIRPYHEGEGMSELDQTDFQTTGTVLRDGLACFEKSDGIFNFEWAGSG